VNNNNNNKKSLSIVKKAGGKIKKLRNKYRLKKSFLWLYLINLFTKINI
jgi:hypothetical protein